MAGVLTFDQYIGGPDQLIIEQAFPSNQRSVVYNFNRDITDWTFESDYQTIVVDTVKFNRYTGQPNFSDSKIIGTFPLVEITDPELAPAAINPAVGTVKVTFPADMYTGPVVPDARLNVPIVVVGFTWRIAAAPVQTFTHRWAFMQAWEPDVPVGNPVNDPNFIPLVLA
jgi:hypothetical protein